MCIDEKCVVKLLFLINVYYFFLEYKIFEEEENIELNFWWKLNKINVIFVLCFLCYFLFIEKYNVMWGDFSNYKFFLRVNVVGVFCFSEILNIIYIFYF